MRSTPIEPPFSEPLNEPCIAPLVAIVGEATKDEEDAEWLFDTLAVFMFTGWKAAGVNLFDCSAAGETAEPVT